MSLVPIITGGAAPGDEYSTMPVGGSPAGLKTGGGVQAVGVPKALSLTSQDPTISSGMKAAAATVAPTGVDNRILIAVGVGVALLVAAKMMRVF